MDTPLKHNGVSKKLRSYSWSKTLGRPGSHFGQNYVGQVFFDQISVGQMNIGQMSFGQILCRPNVVSAKCRVGQMSCRPNVCRPNVVWAKCLSANCRSTPATLCRQVRASYVDSAERDSTEMYSVYVTVLNLPFSPLHYTRFTSTLYQIYSVFCGNFKTVARFTDFLILEK